MSASSRNGLPPQPSPRASRAFVAGVISITFLATIAVWWLPLVATASQHSSSASDLVKLRDEWVEDLRTKQLDPILKLYAPNAAFLQPNGQRIAGAANLHSLFHNIMATFNSDLTLNSRSLEASGDLAYDSGDFTETLTNIVSGAVIHSKGSYMVIYRRPPDGRWRIVQHVWTGIPPAGT